MHVLCDWSGALLNQIQDTGIVPVGRTIRKARMDNETRSVEIWPAWLAASRGLKILLQSCHGLQIE